MMKNTIRYSLSMFMLFISILATDAQIYIEKQTRHRFAQMTLGIDGSVGIGGSTTYLDQGGNRQTLNFAPTLTPRFIIGGTHFWGHADFLIAIPLFGTTQTTNNQTISSITGVETIFKYYPWRIENNKLRPYVGVSLAPFNFSQDNNNFEFSKGPSKNLTRLPLVAGVSFNRKNLIFEAGVLYNYNNSIDYHISRSQTAKVNMQAVSFNVTAKYLMETTISAEKDWESGKTKDLTEKLAKLGKLNAWFIGVGLSSAWWLKDSEYNQDNRAYLPIYDTNIMLDYTAGYYFHKPDLDISLNYRGYTGRTEAYGTKQSARRRSVALELKKYLFDYQGFVPFIGPIASYEAMKFVEVHEDDPRLEFADQQFAYGVTFGWDIRPNRLQGFLLRTNLRYFPNLNLPVGGKVISYDNIEFNFIQLVVFPGRIF
ncbi:hypothetical protein N9B82_02215 [Saprospiraceae bacterium]|nr:hypothetical protein [Saprospiraceae bacterium]